MEEKTYTLNIRQTSTYPYEVTVPEIGTTKAAPTLDSALTITLHDILEHLTTRSLIRVFAEHRADIEGRRFDQQERPLTGQERQTAFEVAQMGIVPQVKRRERHLVFELSRPLTREQATWFDEHVGKLFDRYHIKDEHVVQLDTPAEGSARKAEGSNQ